MNKSSGDRLKEVREKRFETAKAAADAFGWNEVTYRSHESGGRNFPLSTARKYAQAFGTTAAHLLGIGSGANSSPINQVILLPLVARVSAGAFRLDEGSDMDGIQVPAVPHSDIPPEAQYALIVEDQSVNKRIADGAYAICAPLDRYPGGPRHGQFVHVVRERAGMHEHTIKKIHYTPKGTLLMPYSTDPRYQDAVKLDAPEDDTIVRIHGVVIGVFEAL